MDYQQLGEILKKKAATYGCVKTAAAAFGVSGSRLSFMMLHPTAISKPIAARLGYRIVRKLSYEIVPVTGGHKRKDSTGQ